MNKEQTSGFRMEGNAFQGDLNKLKERVRQQWGSNLSEEEIEQCEDNRERFLGLVEKKCGIPKEKADKTLRNIERQCAA